MTDAIAPAEVTADYFDGRTARAHAVRLRVESGRLVIDGDGIHLGVPLAGLSWPERTRHGARLLQLPDGASLHGHDSLLWDRWSADAAGRRDSLVVLAQQRWKWVMVSVLVLAGLIALGYRDVVPWAARAVVAALPMSTDEAIGESALASIDANGLTSPSALPEARRRAVDEAFARAVARLPAGEVPRYRLEFRKSRIGPNAFALPGGPIVLTDELYERVDGDPDILVGVLGHELGHLRHRHGMRMLVQASVLSVAAAGLYGDFSMLFAQVPAMLGQASYSRDAEREADVESVRLLRASHISPSVMARFFAMVRRPRPGGEDGAAMPSRVPIGLASHPADEERIRFFEKAAAGG